MMIANPCVVSLQWTLADTENTTLDELTEPVEFYYGGDDLLPKIEEALEGQTVGFEAELHLEPEHAFGDYDPDLVCFEDRSLFPSHLEEGMQFDGLPEGSVTPAMPTDVIYTITEVYPSHVVLDGNHPFAGMALRLHIKVMGVRAATDEEVEARAVNDGPLSVLAAAPTPPHLH